MKDFASLEFQVKKGNFQLVRMEWVPVLSPALLDWVFHSKSRPGDAGACRHTRECPGTWLTGSDATAERYSCSAKSCTKKPEGCPEGCIEKGALCAAETAGVCRRNGGNRGGYVNADVDRLLDQASVTTDPKAQAGLYAQIQHQLARDLPYVSLWHEDRVWIVRKPWTGIALKPSGSLLSLLNARRESQP